MEKPKANFIILIIITICIHCVAGVPRFSNCNGTENSCVINREVTAGDDITLDYDIVYDNGGCDNQDLRLRLDHKRDGTTSHLQLLPPGNYTYDCATKTRHVQTTLRKVNITHQGLYNLTMTALNYLQRDDGASWLAVNLTVRG